MSELIQKITEKQAGRLIDRHGNNSMKKEDQGLFLIDNVNGSFSAIDNSTWNCWTEDFKTRFEAVRWLCGKEKE